LKITFLKLVQTLILIKIDGFATLRSGSAISTDPVPLSNSDDLGGSAGTTGGSGSGSTTTSNSESRAFSGSPARV